MLIAVICKWMTRSHKSVARTTHLTQQVVRRLNGDDTLMNAHLISIPRLRAFTARRLAARNAQRLRRHAHWATHRQAFRFSRLQ